MASHARTYLTVLSQQTIEKLREMGLDGMAEGLAEQARKPDLRGFLEDIDYRTPRGLDRGLLRHLAGREWLSRDQNVLITGPTGAGKTFIACALGNAACRQGFSTLYASVPSPPGRTRLGQRRP